jgi:hypothetical protein
MESKNTINCYNFTGERYSRAAEENSKQLENSYQPICGPYES